MSAHDFSRRVCIMALDRVNDVVVLARRLAELRFHVIRGRMSMLPGVEFEYTWGGSLALSRNHMGHFGQLAPNVYGALCCNGLGVTRGTVTGTLLADHLAGERNALIDFLLSSPGPNRNPPEPLLSIGVNANLWLGQRRAGREV